MSKMRIKSIDWERVFLIIEFTENIDKEMFLVNDKRREKILPEYIKENFIKLPITCAYDDCMIAEGEWKLLYDNEFIEYDISNISDLEKKDKVYYYKNSNYAYIVTFSISEDFELILKISYMKKNLKIKDNNVISKNKFNKNNISNIIAKILFFFLNIEYKILSVLYRKKGNKLLFMSETRSKIEGNLLALKNRLEERNLDKDFKLYFSFKKVLKERKSLIYYIKLMNLFAKVDFIFIDDYAPTFNFINLKKTKLIQLWHAGVGFKSVGYSRFGKDGSPHPLVSSHRKYDYAVVASENLIPVYQEVFGLTKKHFIAPGMLRMDGYLNPNKIETTKEKIFNKYPMIKDKRIILFAPTYRGTGQETAYYDFDKIDLSKLYNLCKEGNYVTLFKFHPFIKQKINIPTKYKDYLMDVSDYGDINELFYITDILITDYSSNIYEFSIFEKPILYFDYDLEEYAALRGVHNSLEDSPGNVCKTFDEIINIIKNEKFDLDKIKKFKNNNIVYNDSKACDRLIKELFDK